MQILIDLDGDGGHAGFPYFLHQGVEEGGPLTIIRCGRRRRQARRATGINHISRASTNAT